MTHQQFSEALIKSGYGKYFNLMEGEFEEEPSEWSLKKNSLYPSNLIRDYSVKLEVHHKYYIWDKLPWEYDLNVLTTMCEECHEYEHFSQDQDRVVYSDDTLSSKKSLISCVRCHGKGYLREYNHVENGICFNCWGYGGVIAGTEKNLFRIK